jgi:hypothetical protein
MGCAGSRLKLSGSRGTSVLDARGTKETGPHSTDAVTTLYRTSHTRVTHRQLGFSTLWGRGPNDTVAKTSQCFCLGTVSPTERPSRTGARLASRLSPVTQSGIASGGSRVPLTTDTSARAATLTRAQPNMHRTQPAGSHRFARTSSSTTRRTVARVQPGGHDNL